jgi:hypothetical protein
MAIGMAIAIRMVCSCRGAPRQSVVLIRASSRRTSKAPTQSGVLNGPLNLEALRWRPTVLLHAGFRQGQVRREIREATRLANENDERWQSPNLNQHLHEVVVQVKRRGHGNQAEISSDSKNRGLAP